MCLCVLNNKLIQYFLFAIQVPCKMFVDFCQLEFELLWSTSSFFCLQNIKFKHISLIFLAHWYSKNNILLLMTHTDNNRNTTKIITDSTVQLHTHTFYFIDNFLSCLWHYFHIKWNEWFLHIVPFIFFLSILHRLTISCYLRNLT